MEKIKEIRELTELSDDMEGYEVVTNKQSIKLLIDNRQSCCENWGYFWCNDDPLTFIGTTVRGVTLTDTALNEARMKYNDIGPNSTWFEGGLMFVNIDTNQGVLQFVAYNRHNGYYGHLAKVECIQLKHVETL